MDAAWIPTKERQTRTIDADHFVMPLLIETLGPRKRKSRVDMAIEMSGANYAQKGAGILTSLPQASRPTRRQWCRWRVPRIDRQTML
jgi:hypothetical protein